MQTLQANIEPDGALVDILLGLSSAQARSLRRSGSPLPQPVAARALLDTGADVSCADSRVLAPLLGHGLRPIRFVFTNMPALGGLALAGEYSVNLTIVHPSRQVAANLTLHDLPLVEQSLGALGYEFLLGRDVLAHCLLVCDGPGRRLTLGY
jgi:hypothetical protein